MENYRISTCHKNIFCLCHYIVKRRLTTKPVSFIYLSQSLVCTLGGGGWCKAMGRSPGTGPGSLQTSEHRDFSPCTSQSLLCWTPPWLEEKKGKQFCLTTVWLHKVEGKLLKASVFVNVEFCQHSAALRHVFLLETAEKVYFPCIFFSLLISDGQGGPGFGDLGSRETRSQLRDPNSIEFSTLRQDLEHKNSPTSKDAHERTTPRTRHRRYVIRMAESGLVP